MQIVLNPMSIIAIEKKIKGEKYSLNFDKFLSDIVLIRDNCYLYNTGTSFMLSVFLSLW